MLVGVFDVVAVGIADQLSAHPEIGLRGLLMTAGAALFGYARKYVHDYSIEELPWEWRKSIEPKPPADGEGCGHGDAS